MAPALLSEQEMIKEERLEIDRRNKDAAGAPGPTTNQLGLAALCLSGGGIRSAAFSLGVIQSLGAVKLLNKFDYLSTVSGGGYIGGWLQMVIREAGAQGLSVKDVERDLGNGVAPALSRLRGYTNYLTPEGGAFTADTWAGIALYLRNIIINWMVFTPVFLLLALWVVFYRTALFAFAGDTWLVAALVVLATLALTFSACKACTLLPSHRAQLNTKFPKPNIILRNVVIPSLAWAFLIPLLIERDIAGQRAACLAGQTSSLHAMVSGWLVPVLYLFSMLAGYGVAWLLEGKPTPARPSYYYANVSRWLAATLVLAGIIAAGLQAILPCSKLYTAALYRLTSAGPLLVDGPTALAVLMPLGLIVAHLLHTTVYVAIRREGLLADLDREWLARVSGLALRIGIAATTLAVCCLLLPPLIGLVDNEPHGDLWRILMGGGASVAIGGPAAWIGKKVASRIEALAEQSGDLMLWVLNGLAFVFAVILLATSGALVEYGAGILQNYLACLTRTSLPDGMALSPYTSLALQALLAAILVGLVALFGQVNVNRFSLHAVYRNRLARAFLGTARDTREPDPFTGFDQRDNQRLMGFVDNTAKQRLFPVINVTLNVTRSTNTAWTERKAESFTATPLHCGAAMLRRTGQPATAKPQGAYVSTSQYAGMDTAADAKGRNRGVRIGTMQTISGAAASPNWGYHSSPATAFLMTLFNVRLGAWFANPAHSTGLQLALAKPANSLLALLRELAGVTTDTSQAVYLSDGGHFENLGLYEMLRRRCRLIVVVDAGQDEDCTFFDLGNAIRKASIDLGAYVKMKPMRIRSRREIETGANPALAPLGFAVGTIQYPNAPDGRLIYLKPSFLAGIPADVRAFGLSNPAFPHVTTADQFFTESEFESYRALGFWQMEEVSRRATTLTELFDFADGLT